MKAGVFTSRAMMRNVVCLLVLGLMVLIVVRPRTDDSSEGTQLVEERDSSVTVMKGLERGLDSRVGDEEDLGVDMTVKFDEREQPSLSELLVGYDKRRELVSRVCQQQRDDLEARYKTRWPDRGWEGVLAMADVLEKRDRGFLWCKVPKAASESWTSLFIQQWYGRKKNQLMWKQQVLLHAAWAPRRTAAYIKKISNTHFSFMTVRHPFERLLSAYRDKFFPNGPAKFEKEKVERWYEWYGREIIEGYRKIPVMDSKYETSPTFREFMEYLVDLPLEKYDAHWKPVYLQCLPCHIHYRVIAPLESLARDSAYILSAIGVAARLPHSHTTQGRTLDTVRQYYSTLDIGLVKKLYNIYKPDFLLFNYTVDAYPGYVGSQSQMI